MNQKLRHFETCSTREVLAFSLEYGIQDIGRKESTFYVKRKPDRTSRRRNSF